jgi:hypothetical protein
MKEFYTYLHRNTNGRVFYVGCSTTNLTKRGTRAKLQRAYSTSGHTNAWMIAAASGYTVEIIKIHSTKDAAYQQEIMLIAELRKNGEPLVNICTGGPGAPGAKNSDETRQKKSITKIGECNPMHNKKGLDHPTSRAVVVPGYGYIFQSVQEAADFFGIKMKTLYNQLSGHRSKKINLEFV